MKKRSLLPVVIMITVAIAFFTGFFAGRATAVQGTKLTALTVSLAVPSAPAAPEITFPDPSRKININTAAAEELSTLPGIGESLAQDIVLYRKINGPFTTVDQLKNINGIGDKRLDAIRSQISTGE